LQEPENKGEANRCFAESVLSERGIPHPRHPVVAFGIPHPRYFAQRGCKLLKIKEGNCEKRGKRVQEAASC